MNCLSAEPGAMDKPKSMMIKNAMEKVLSVWPWTNAEEEQESDPVVAVQNIRWRSILPVGWRIAVKTQPISNRNSCFIEENQKWQIDRGIAFCGKTKKRTAYMLVFNLKVLLLSFAAALHRQIHFAGCRWACWKWRWLQNTAAIMTLSGNSSTGEQVNSW